MRSHPLENACDERGESWAELVTLLIVALFAGVVCMIWDGAVDAWRAVTRRARR
jgi:hypothetical protein